MILRVGIVDDHPIIREGVRALLAAEPDLEVIGEAGTGAEALRLLEEVPVDLLILDVGLPDLSGIDLTRRVKERYPEIAVLLLTLHDDVEYLLEGMRAGASGYVVKHLAGRDLVAAVRAVAQGQTVFRATALQELFADRAGAEGPPLQGPAPFEGRPPLTEREREVLRWVASGETTRAIAERLCISVKTVETHRAHIMEKLGLHDVASLTRYAVAAGIVPAGRGGGASARGPSLR